jgi:hypothetical protein
MAMGNGSLDPSLSGENFLIIVLIPCLGGRFFPRPKSDGIPVSNITKKFFLYPIPDLNPTGNPYPINHYVAEPRAIEMFYFLLIGPIAGHAGKRGWWCYLIPKPINPMGIIFSPYPFPREINSFWRGIPITKWGSVPLASWPMGVVEAIDIRRGRAKELILIITLPTLCFSRIGS